jgi:hypothetical protein
VSRYRPADLARFGEPARRQIDLAMFAHGARDALAQERKSKYGNHRTMLDEQVFDSKAEADRWAELRMLQRAGKITELICQPEFPIAINGHKIASYSADFRYIHEHGKLVIEDVKSEGTRNNAVYRLKKKLTEALHGVVISEVIR